SAMEILRASHAVAQARHAQQIAAACKREAALARFVKEMRHNINNALTAVLGNAELMMLESDLVLGSAREQVQIVHAMALRIHQTMQELSSLENKLAATEKETTHTRVRACVA